MRAAKDRSEAALSGAEDRADGAEAAARAAQSQLRVRSMWRHAQKEFSQRMQRDHGVRVRVPRPHRRSCVNLSADASCCWCCCCCKRVVFNYG